MAFEIPGFKPGCFAAAANLSTKQYRAMVVADGLLVNVAGAGVDIVGVLQNAPDAAGQAAEIMVSGITKMVCDDTCNAGEVVKVGSSGGCVDGATSGKGIGIALSDGVTNDIIPVLLKDLGTQS